SVDGVRLGAEGEIPLGMIVADDREQADRRRDEIRDLSRESGHQNDLFWVMVLTPEIDELVAELYRSREMIRKYDALSAQGKISAEESSALPGERSLAARREGQLRDQLEQALVDGVGFFRGAARVGGDLGRTVVEAF